MITDQQIAELQAIEATTREIGGPTFQWKGNWRSLYCGLVRKRLVTWKQPPKGSNWRAGNRFRMVELTDRGRQFLLGL